MFHLVKVPGPPMLLKDQYLARELQDRTVIPINTPNFDDVEVEGQKPALQEFQSKRISLEEKWSCPKIGVPGYPQIIQNYTILV